MNAPSPCDPDTAGRTPRQAGEDMLGVVCHAPADYETLSVERLPRPPMRPHGVRIATHFAGVSFATTLVTARKHQTKPPFPFVPGTEVSGIVTECAPEVTRLRVGERVCASPDWGGHAEEVVALEHNVFRLPDSLPLDVAVQMPLSYGTAYGALVWRARLQPGETLLVFGASGAVGLAAVEVGKALGAVVIACVGTPEKADFARRHGADHALLNDREDLAGEIRRLTGGRGIDVTFDPVGGFAFDVAMKVAAGLGRIVLIGFAAGQWPSIPGNILLVKNIDVLGFYFGRYIWDSVVPRVPWDREVAQAFDALFAWHTEGRLRPSASHIFALTEFRAAMRAVIERRGIGKVVLRMPAAGSVAQFDIRREHRDEP